MKDKQRNPLDDLFRKKLNEEQPDPDEKLWKEIEIKFAAKNKSRYGFVLLLACLLLLSGVVYYFAGVRNSSESKMVSENMVRNNGEQIDSKKDVQSSVPLVLSVETVKQKTGETSSNTNNNQTTHEIKVQSNASSKGLSHKNNATTYSQNNENGKKEKGFSETNKINTKSADVNLNVVKQNESFPMVLEDQNKWQPVEHESGISDKTNVSETTITPDENPDNDLSVTIPKKDSTSTKSSSTKGSGKSDFRIILKSHPVWYVSGAVNYLYNSKRIKTEGNINPNYLKTRRSGEQGLPTFNYAVRLGVQIKHLQIEGGVNYSDLGEKINYKMNDSIALRNGASHNIFIEIPVTGYYRFSVHSFIIQIGAGIAACTPSGWHSYYLNKDLSKIENPLIENKLNPFLLNANASAGAVIPFGTHFDAVVSLEYRKNLGSIFKKTYLVDQKYQSTGLGFGIRYKINP